MTDPRRGVPRTDSVLADPRIEAAVERLGVDLVKRAVREVQERVRAGAAAPESVVEQTLATLPEVAASLHAVINATGVILHTNLGRAPLSQAAVDALVNAAGYVDVEYDLETGTRAFRGAGAAAALLRRVRGAHAALVVNNGAAALVLAATALAAGREIVVSRGELVEIGDGFRLPTLLASTGARLREVGTTNRTTVADYAEVVGPDTGFVLKVHPSNFTVSRFTSSVTVAELASLGAPVVADIGSGLLEPDPLMPDEPDATSWLRDGATIVTASGDKLLGGPQAGIVLGDGETIERLRRCPLYRALRVDKLTLAALEASVVGPPTPTHLALHVREKELRIRAEKIVEMLPAAIGAGVVASSNVVGGGGAPALRLPGWAIELPPEFAAALRRGTPAVIARVEQGVSLVDMRGVGAADDDRVRVAIVAAATRLDVSRSGSTSQRRTLRG